MLRRGVGVGALKKREQTQATFKEVGAKLEQGQLAHLHSSLDSFRSSLESFAFQHKAAIQSNPLFRAQFHRMCMATGVDPLACHKGVWASVLGLGDFYFELSVQIVDVALSARERTGGLMELQEVLALLKAKHRFQQNITLDDLVQSIGKLACLGSGFQLIQVGGANAKSNLGRHLLKSVPLEMEVDHLALIECAAGQQQEQTSTSSSSSSSSSSAAPTAASASSKGCVLVSSAQRQLGWNADRINRCIRLLLDEGMVWLDAQGDEPSYWFPSLTDTPVAR